MRLTVGERLLLLSILPQEGSLTTVRIVDELRRDLSFSEGEHKELQFKQEDGHITWEGNGRMPKDVEIGVKAAELINGTLAQLSADGKITTQHLELCDKFEVKE